MHTRLFFLDMFGSTATLATIMLAAISSSLATAAVSEFPGLAGNERDLGTPSVRYHPPNHAPYRPPNRAPYRPPYPAPSGKFCRKKPTKGSLNSCDEQKQCFSITYESVSDETVGCDDNNCDFLWKVCIEINNKDPCCRKRKQIFKRACIRGKEEGEADESDSCLTDEDSLNYLDRLKGLKDGEKYCDIVRPGQSAKFQLVSTLMGLGIQTKKHELSSHLAFLQIFGCLSTNAARR